MQQCWRWPNLIKLHWIIIKIFWKFVRKKLEIENGYFLLTRAWPCTPCGGQGLDSNPWERLAQILLLACYKKRLKHGCAKDQWPSHGKEEYRRKHSQMKSNRLLNDWSLFVPLLHIQPGGINGGHGVGKSPNTQRIKDRQWLNMFEGLICLQKFLLCISSFHVITFQRTICRICCQDSPAGGRGSRTHVRGCGKSSSVIFPSETA